MGNHHSNITQIFRSFLLSFFNKQLWIFLFFLCISAAFWLMITLNDVSEQEYIIPVRLSDVPKSIIITSEAEDTIKVSLRDKKMFLLAYKHTNLMQPLDINFSIYANGTSKGTINNAELQKSIRQRLYSSSSIVSLKPDHWEFSYVRGISKVVPVRLAERQADGDNFYASKVKITPEHVEIYAQKDNLDSIDAAFTEPLSIESLNDTVVKTVRLKKIGGVKFIPDVVQVKLYPDVLTESFVEVPIKTVNVPEGKALRLFPSRVKINFATDAGNIRNITPEDFTVEADYQGLRSVGTEKCTIKLVKIPQGIRNPNLEVKQVDYLIETL